MRFVGGWGEGGGGYSAVKSALDGLPVVKHLSDTRWAAHSDASKALNCGNEIIRMVFNAINIKPG